MKNLLILLIGLSISMPYSDVYANSDSTSHWNLSFQPMLTINQAHFSNWAAGGQSSISVSQSFEADITFRDEKCSWETQYQHNFGVARISEVGKFTKTQDQIVLLTKLGLSQTKHSKLTLFSNIITQGFDGFVQNELGEEERNSTFFSPGFITSGIGYEYSNDSIGINADFSPLAGKQTIVLDDAIDVTKYGIDPDKSARNEFGAYLQLSYKKEILKRTELRTHLLLFTNYQDIGKMDVYWRGRLNVHANDWLAMTLQTQLVFDKDVDLATFKDVNGDGIPDVVGTASKLQFMQILGLGATVKF